MTQEHKELLLKDLCARLPYGVKFMCNKNIYTTKGLDLIVTNEGDWEYAVTTKGTAPIEIDFIKPYLFPLSSMTEEQKMFLKQQNWCIAISTSGTVETTIEGIDWLNKNHFDYRCLIESGLAINATGLNIY